MVGRAAAGAADAGHHALDLHHHSAAGEPQAPALHGSLRSLRPGLRHAGKCLPHAQALHHHMDPFWRMVLCG